MKMNFYLLYILPVVRTGRIGCWPATRVNELSLLCVCLSAEF